MTRRYSDGVKVGMGRITPVERLIERLTAAGFDVIRVDPVRGYWAREDVLRWTASVRTPHGSTTIGSWDDVTDCARFGFEVSTAGTTMSGYPEVHALAHRKRKARR